MSYYDPVSVLTKSVNMGVDSLASAIAGASNNAVLKGIANQAASFAKSKVSSVLTTAQNKIYSKADRLLRPLNKYGVTGLADLLGILNNRGLTAFGLTGDEYAVGAGGLTWREIYLLTDAMLSEPKYFKNLFLLEIDSPIPIGKSYGEDYGNFFNVMVKNLSLSPVTIGTEVVQFGSGECNRIQNNGRTEMQATFMDDEIGTLKSWAKALTTLTTGQSHGLYAVPSEYLIRVKVRFGVSKGDMPAFSEEYANMMVSEITHELDRSAKSETGEVQLKFVQWDNFMPSVSDVAVGSLAGGAYAMGKSALSQMGINFLP